MDICWHGLMNKWNVIRSIHNEILKKVSDNLSTIGMNTREEETGTTPQYDLSSLTGLESGFAFDTSDTVAFDLKNSMTPDATEFDIQEMLNLQFTEETTDYASPIDHSNFSGPVVRADTDQSQLFGRDDFFGM